MFNEVYYYLFLVFDTGKTLEIMHGNNQDYAIFAKSLIDNLIQSKFLDKSIVSTRLEVK